MGKVFPSTASEYPGWRAARGVGGRYETMKPTCQTDDENVFAHLAKVRDKFDHWEYKSLNINRWVVLELGTLTEGIANTLAAEEIIDVTPLSPLDLAGWAIKSTVCQASTPSTLTSPISRLMSTMRTWERTLFICRPAK